MHESVRLTGWQLVELGREVRVARVTGGRTQLDVARSVRTSRARISRFERGRLPTVTFAQLGRITGAVGLKLYVRAYPAGRRLLDQPQLALLAELRRRANPAWGWETEVPMPIAGDLRAADAVATLPGCSVVVELWTRLIDVQAQTRAALLKARDLHAQRVVLVLKASRANRAALRMAGPQPSFPLTTRPLLQAFAQGRDPGENGILLL
jgi:transcriptional regulator with XRE-family HTH domain